MRFTHLYHMFVVHTIIVICLTFSPFVFALSDTDSDGVLDFEDVDIDGDGLIEISTLAELNNIRNNLSGNAYNNGIEDDSNGCGDGDLIIVCNGYELINDLNFVIPNTFIIINDFLFT